MVCAPALGGPRCGHMVGLSDNRDGPLCMSRLIHPTPGIAGEVTLPGDKSISHRYAMLSAVASGRSVLENYATGEDCASTLDCLHSLGVRWERRGDRVTIEGRGPDGLQPPSAPLDAGNSGTTMRMLSGILAGQPFASVLQGDASLSKRPMSRIIAPLRQMGACIDGRDGRFPPLSIRGGGLRAVRYELPVASAQVKSCVLLAGLFAGGGAGERSGGRLRLETTPRSHCAASGLHLAPKVAPLPSGAPPACPAKTRAYRATSPRPCSSWPPRCCSPVPT